MRTNETGARLITIVVASAIVIIIGIAFSLREDASKLLILICRLCAILNALIAGNALTLLLNYRKEKNGYNSQRH